MAHAPTEQQCQHSLIVGTENHSFQHFTYRSTSLAGICALSRDFFFYAHCLPYSSKLQTVGLAVTDNSFLCLRPTYCGWRHYISCVDPCVCVTRIVNIISCNYWTDFHQTYSNDTIRDRDQHFGFWGQRVKIQGDSGIEYAANNALRTRGRTVAYSRQFLGFLVWLWKSVVTRVIFCSRVIEVNSAKMLKHS